MKRMSPFLKIALSASVILICMAAWFRVHYVIVRGPSMEPTYKNGSWLALDRLDDAQKSQLHVGDVIVFNVPGEVMPIMKRIAAVPGGSYTIYRTRVGAKGKWSNDFLYQKPKVSKGCKAEQVQLPPNTFWVLADNWIMTTDSRTFGPIPSSAIIGKVADQRKLDVVAARNYMPWQGY